MNVWVGIDPGLGCTGVAILIDSVLRDFTTVSVPPLEDVPLQARVDTVAAEVTGWLVENLPTGTQPIIVCEHPIFGHNPLGFAKQVKLLQCVEEYLFDNGCVHWVGGRLVEVLPHSPRQRLGLKVSAKKEEVQAKFLEVYATRMEGLTKVRREAIGDAWAIARCAEKRAYWYSEVEFGKRPGREVGL